MRMPPTRPQAPDTITLEGLKLEPMKNVVFKMRCNKIENFHKQHATFFVDKIIAIIQPYFNTELDGTLFTSNYVHAHESFVYGTPVTIADKIAQYCAEPFSQQVADGSFYELKHDPTAVIQTKENIKFEDVTYGWLYLPVDLPLRNDQISGARIADTAGTRTLSRPLHPTIHAGPLFKYLQEKMRLSLDTRAGAIHQAVDKTDNAGLPRFRFQFAENPDFQCHRLLQYHSGDFTIAGKAVSMVINQKYMKSYRICNLCRKWDYNEKEMMENRIPRGLICTCVDDDKEEKRKSIEKRDNNKAARKRKLLQVAGSSDAANPFMNT